MIRLRPKFWRKHRREMYANATTRDRKRNLFELLMLLLFLALSHTLAMVLLEDLTVWEAFWLTMTTMTTVGYGDTSATTPAGQMATVVLMYVFGIFLLAQIAGEFIDFRMDRRDRMRRGLWRWKMDNHIVIINTPDKDGDRYLQILVEQIRRSTSLEEYPILIFSPNYPDGLPSELASLGVVLKHGEPEGRVSLAEVDVEKAAFIVVLTVNASDYRSDSLTLDILDQLKQFNVPGHVIAECVQDENRTRLRAHGANAVLRPVRAYPELMVRAMAAPGTESILEDLFQHQGVHPRRYDVAIPDQNWGALASRLLVNGMGTPLGYLNLDNEIVTNPGVDNPIQGTALFILVNHDRVPSISDVSKVVDAV
ncbi:MAG: potassium channel family protein [Pseudomonadales bacterium]